MSHVQARVFSDSELTPFPLSLSFSHIHSVSLTVCRLQQLPGGQRLGGGEELAHLHPKEEESKQNGGKGSHKSWWPSGHDALRMTHSEGYRRVPGQSLSATSATEAANVVDLQEQLSTSFLHGSQRSSQRRPTASSLLSNSQSDFDIVYQSHIASPKESESNLDGRLESSESLYGDISDEPPRKDGDIERAFGSSSSGSVRQATGKPSNVRPSGIVRDNHHSVNSRLGANGVYLSRYKYTEGPPRNDMSAADEPESIYSGIDSPMLPATNSSASASGSAVTNGNRSMQTTSFTPTEEQDTEGIYTVSMGPGADENDQFAGQPSEGIYSMSLGPGADENDQFTEKQSVGTYRVSQDPAADKRDHFADKPPSAALSGSGTDAHRPSLQGEGEQVVCESEPQRSDSSLHAGKSNNPDYAKSYISLPIYDAAVSKMKKISGIFRGEKEKHVARPGAQGRFNGHDQATNTLQQQQQSQQAPGDETYILVDSTNIAPREAAIRKSQRIAKDTGKSVVVPPRSDQELAEEIEEQYMLVDSNTLTPRAGPREAVIRKSKRGKTETGKSVVVGQPPQADAENHHEDYYSLTPFQNVQEDTWSEEAKVQKAEHRSIPRLFSLKGRSSIV